MATNYILISDAAICTWVESLQLSIMVYLEVSHLLASNHRAWKFNKHRRSTGFQQCWKVMLDLSSGTKVVDLWICLLVT